MLVGRDQWRIYDGIARDPARDFDLSLNDVEELLQLADLNCSEFLDKVEHCVRDIPLVALPDDLRDLYYDFSDDTTLLPLQLQKARARLGHNYWSFGDKYGDIAELLATFEDTMNKIRTLAATLAAYKAELGRDKTPPD
jgi:hypothetical protein